MRSTQLALLLVIALPLACGCDDDDSTATDASGDATSTSGGDLTLADTSGTTDASTAADSATTATDTATVGDTTTGLDQTDAADPDMGIPPVGACRPEPFDTGASYASALYLDPNGSDETGDGTRDAPWATLPHAAQAATPGTELVLLEGTYALGGTWFVDGLAGTAAEPIRIRGEGQVVLDAGGAQEALHLIEPHFVVVADLTVTNAAVNGLNIDDGGTFDTPAADVVLRNLVLRDIGTGGNNDCVKLSGLDDFFVLDSEFTGCNAGNSIDMVGCHDGVIAGNHFHDTASGIQAKGGSSGTLITGNRFVDVPGRNINAGGSTGLEFFRPIDAPHEAADLRVVGNLFVRSGAESGAAIAFVGCDACIFAHNTLVEPQTWLARILQETVDPARFVPSRDGIFANNIVVFRAADLRNGTYVNVGGDTAPETFTFASNLWWELDDPGFGGPSYSGGIPAETDAILGLDPMLDAAWRTPAGSPAVGAAQVVVPGGPYGDFTGVCFGDPAAVGAFEP